MNKSGEITIDELREKLEETAEKARLLLRPHEQKMVVAAAVVITAVALGYWLGRRRLANNRMKSQQLS